MLNGGADTDKCHQDKDDTLINCEIIDGNDKDDKKGKDDDDDED